MILSVAELKEHITTTLGDDALLTLLGAAEEAIIRAVGPASAGYTITGVTERFSPHGPLLMLSRRAYSITEVREGTTTLASNDYELSSTRLALRRLRSGTHPRYWWGHETAVTYEPYIDEDSRAAAQIELVRLELAFKPGLASYTTGSDSETFATGVPYDDQRAAILATLIDPLDGGIW